MAKFSPGKAMTAFFVFFFPILIYLGSWQVSRGIEKQVIVDRHFSNKSLPTIDEIELDGLEKNFKEYRSIRLNGTYENETYILDNRLYRQEAGYEIFTKFKTVRDNIFLVNRGWISKENFNYSEEVAIHNEIVSAQGIISPFKRFGLDLTSAESENYWPKYVQELDYSKAKSDLGPSLNSFVLQLSAGSVGSLEPIWKPTEVKPSRHYGYAVQWFGLALVLISSFVYFGLKGDKNELSK